MQRSGIKTAVAAVPSVSIEKEVVGSHFAVPTHTPVPYLFQGQESDDNFMCDSF